jgi:hypothetical protein
MGNSQLISAQRDKVNAFVSGGRRNARKDTTRGATLNQLRWRESQIALALQYESHFCSGCAGPAGIRMLWRCWLGFWMSRRTQAEIATERNSPLTSSVSDSSRADTPHWWYHRFSLRLTFFMLLQRYTHSFPLILSFVSNPWHANGSCP